MTTKRYDQLFGEIVSILRRDHAGAELLSGLDPRYYNQAVGQAWHDGKLDALLFLRYISQMLACTGERHLRLVLRPDDGYTPWGPGFFTRRYGDSLYVTAVTGESRLAAGDRILAVNGGSPAAHRAGIQKNFFYAGTPEREDWNGLLKMADAVTVARGDETWEMPLARHAPSPPVSGPALKTLPGGGVYLRPGPFDGAGRTAALAAAEEKTLSAGRGLILDLRNASGGDEEEALSLLPWVCRADTPLSALTETEYYVNYSPLNCALRAGALRGVPGGETYITELAEKAGAGLVLENTAGEEIVPGRAGSGAVVVLVDTWCRDGGETLALAAKRAGACLLGRPTLGTADFCGDVACGLDDRYTLVWPTAVTKAAREGRGVMGRGIDPERYIPWTPEECERDVLLDAAREYLGA